jgi:hypothetical protein
MNAIKTRKDELLAIFDAENAELVNARTLAAAHREAGTLCADFFEDAAEAQERRARRAFDAYAQA